MSEPCCGNQEFTENADPSLAAVARADGAEFTLGFCAACRTPLMEVRLNGQESVAVPVPHEYVAILTNIADPGKRARILRELWEEDGGAESC